ncbi:hypothetical protein [Parendozoicomonas haliclonae]|uniref:Uncharacterized protein n=1 Tax=Parendozoicomonas haliclonae TaxID=1960125 RepID=A0A1X7AQ43_9GAMM|nr:hypothetical protein [Parendozoicomonas haliclonae]SMA50365.1 hypothetical protein EHSB41UT_04162 [Parendozoicomonas haliclonae]
MDATDKPIPKTGSLLNPGSGATASSDGVVSKKAKKKKKVKSLSPDKQLPEAKPGAEAVMPPLNKKTLEALKESLGITTIPDFLIPKTSFDELQSLCRDCFQDGSADRLIYGLDTITDHLPNDIPAKACKLLKQAKSQISGIADISDAKDRAELLVKIEQQCLELFHTYKDEKYLTTRQLLLSVVWWCRLLADERSAVEALQMMDDGQLCRLGNTITDHILLHGDSSFIRTRRSLVLRNSAEHGNVTALEELVNRCLFDEQGFESGFSLEEGFRWLKAWRDLIAIGQLSAPEGDGVIARLVREGRNFIASSNVNGSASATSPEHTLIACGLCLDYRFGSPDYERVERLLKPLILEEGEPSRSTEKKKKAGKPEPKKAGPKLSRRLQGIAYLWKGHLARPSPYDPEYLKQEQAAKNYFARSQALGCPDGLIQYGWSLLRETDHKYGNGKEVVQLAAYIRDASPESLPPEVWLLFEPLASDARYTGVSRFDRVPKPTSKHASKSLPKTVKDKRKQDEDSDKQRVEDGVESAMYHAQPDARAYWLNERLCPTYKAFYRRHYNAHSKEDIEEDDKISQYERKNRKERQEAAEQGKPVLKLFRHIAVDPELLVYRSFGQGTPFKITREQDTSKADALLERAKMLDPVRSGLQMMALHLETDAFPHPQQKCQVYDSVGEWSICRLQILLRSSEYQTRFLDASGTESRKVLYQEIEWAIDTYRNSRMKALQEACLKAGEIDKARAIADCYLHREKPRAVLDNEAIDKGRYIYSNTDNELQLDSGGAETPKGVKAVMANAEALLNSLNKPNSTHSPKALMEVILWAKRRLSNDKQLLEPGDIKALVALITQAYQLYPVAAQGVEQQLVKKMNHLVGEVEPVPGLQEALVQMNTLVSSHSAAADTSSGFKADNCLLALENSTLSSKSACLDKMDQYSLDELHDLLIALNNDGEWHSTEHRYLHESELPIVFLHICERLQGRDISYPRKDSLTLLLAELVNHLVTSSRDFYRVRLYNVMWSLQMSCEFHPSCFPLKEKLWSTFRDTLQPQGTPYTHEENISHDRIDDDYEVYHENCVFLEKAHGPTSALFHRGTSQVYPFLWYLSIFYQQHYSDDQLTTMLKDYEHDDGFIYSKEIQQHTSIGHRIWGKCLRQNYDDDLWRMLMTLPVTAKESFYPLALALVATNTAYTEKWSAEQTDELFESVCKSDNADLWYFRYLWQQKQGDVKEGMKCLIKGSMAGSAVCKLEMARGQRLQRKFDTAEGYFKRLDNRHEPVYGDALYERGEMMLERSTDQNPADCKQVYRQWSQACRYHQPMAVLRVFTCLYPEVNALWCDDHEQELKDRCFVRESLERRSLFETPGRKVCQMLLAWQDSGALDRENLTEQVQQLSIAETMILAQLPEDFWPPMDDGEAYRTQLLETIVEYFSALPPNHPRDVVEGVSVRQLSWFTELAPRLQASVEPDATDKEVDDPAVNETGNDVGTEAEIASLDDDGSVESSDSEKLSGADGDEEKPTVESETAWLEQIENPKSAAFQRRVMELFDKHGMSLFKFIRNSRLRRDCLNALFYQRYYTEALALQKSIGKPECRVGHLLVYLCNGGLLNRSTMITTVLTELQGESDWSGLADKANLVRKIIGQIFDGTYQDVDDQLTGWLITQFAIHFPQLLGDELAQKIRAGQPVKYSKKLLDQLCGCENLQPKLKVLLVAATSGPSRVGHSSELEKVGILKCLQDKSLPIEYCLTLAGLLTHQDLQVLETGLIEELLDAGWKDHRAVGKLLQVLMVHDSQKAYRYLVSERPSANISEHTRRHFLAALWKIELPEGTELVEEISQRHYQYEQRCANSDVSVASLKRRIKRQVTNKNLIGLCASKQSLLVLAPNIARLEPDYFEDLESEISGQIKSWSELAKTVDYEQAVQQHFAHAQTSVK